MNISKGIPIQERTPDDVRRVFEGQEKEVVEAFLKLHHYAQEHHLGVSKLSAQTGISQSSISQSFNGDYAAAGGNLSDTAKRIETFFWRLEQKALYGVLKGFVPTRISKVLWKIYEKTRHVRRIQPVQSPEQVGKTRSAVEYTRLNNSGRTSYYEFNKSVEGLNDFIHSYGVQLGSAKTAKLREKKADIGERLESCDLVILDQFHLIFNLGYKEAAKVLDYVWTDLYCNGERGIVLQCTDDRQTGSFMDGVKSLAVSHNYNVGQLLGRMMVDVVTFDPTEDVTEDDVELLAQRYYKPGKAVLRELTSLAQAERLGHLGLVDYIMGEAWNRTKGKHSGVTDEVVASVIKTVKENLEARKELYS